MREVNDQGHPSIPMVRVWTFGEFVVEHFIPLEEYSPRYEPLAPSSWQSRGTALTLLKVLLCRRRRRATKDELIAAIWPQKEEGAKHLKHVERAFDAAASVLRAVLRTPEGESLLMSRRSGDHMLYRLADQQHLWVDAEACELLVNRAIQMEGQGQTHEGLAVWEEAYRLTQRGVFLEDSENYKDGSFKSKTPIIKKLCFQTVVWYTLDIKAPRGNTHWLNWQCWLHKDIRP